MGRSRWRRPRSSPGTTGPRRPVALEVTRILDEVPPHLVADQLVAEARRVAGVASRCTSSTSTDRACCAWRGQRSSPDQLDSPPALGPGDRSRAAPGVLLSAERAAAGVRGRTSGLRGRVTGLFYVMGDPLGAAGRHRQAGRRGAGAGKRIHRLPRRPRVGESRPRGRGGPAEPVTATNCPYRRRQLAGALFRPTKSGETGLTSSRTATAPGWHRRHRRQRANRRRAGAAALGALRSARRSGKDLEQALEACTKRSGGWTIPISRSPP